MIVFLILHFIALEDTEECVESIMKNIDFSNYKIVIVDNGSPNNSFVKLRIKYADNNRIDILHSEKNLGFARGNNLGFKYAKEKYSPEFLIMVNNDTILFQKDFYKVTSEKYKKYKFAVLGPDIITKDGIHQNPWIRDGLSFKQLKLFRIKQELRILLSYIHLDRMIYRMIHKNDPRSKRKEGDLIDVPLHGAALVFSKKYINLHDGLDDRTFLYFEEEILRSHCKKEKLLMMYTSELQIYHKEDIATKMTAKTPGEKDRTEYRNRIKSSREYERLKKELGEN